MPTRIDAGSSTDYNDTSGNRWFADYGFSGGASTSTTAAVSGTNDQPLYKTQRTGSSFYYTTSISNGKYIVGLAFAETASSVTANGQRVFNVSANGTPLLTGFDIFAASGGANRAVTQNFLVSVTNNQLVLAFTGTTGQATVAAISVLSPAPAPDIPPPGWAEDVMPSDDASDAEGMGPAAASSVNLASGVEENSPGADIAAYNPVGPSASYERRYRSARAQKGYASPGLSPGWTDGYDLSVVPTATGYTLTYDNGGQDQWTGTSGSLGTPPSAPYLVNASTGTLTMTFKDRSKYTFTQISTAGGNYPANAYLLTGIANLVGHTITLNRDTAASGYRLLSVTNDASPALALLTFAYDGTGNLNTVTDAYNRRITYRFTTGFLDSVSPVAAINVTSTVWRWQYGYTPILGAPLLNSVSAPDPSNPGGMATATTTYDPASGSVSQHRDAAGRVHSYGYNGSHTLVQVANVGGSLAESWTQNQNASGAGKNADAGITDAAGNTGSISYANTPSPYLPSAATNHNGQTAQVTYNDSYGNVLSATSPRGVVTTFGYGNPADFALNQVVSVTQTHPNAGGNPDVREPTLFTYYGPSDGVLNGLLETVTLPLPDTTAGNPNTAPATTYSYDSLGNVIQMVGPNANGMMTVAYNYTSDGAASQAEALGEPLSVTASGPDADGNLTASITHFRYDSRGNCTAVIDALGNETDFAYNLADQLTSTTYPAAGDSGTGRVKATTAYQYLGGPESGAAVTDESSVLFRQVVNVYDADGELLQVLGDTHPVLYAYDGAGRVSSVTYYQDPQNPMLGRTTSYGYDTVGNLVAVLYPGSAGAAYDQTYYTYDADGNMASETDGVGVTKFYARLDSESLLTGIAYGYPAGYAGTQIGPVSFGYDICGRRTGMSNDATTVAYAYDDVDELHSTTTNFGYDSYANKLGPQGQQIVYYHNQDGSRQALSMPYTTYGNDQSYQYDGVGRLSATRLMVAHLPRAFQPGSPIYTSHYAYQSNGWLSQVQTSYGGGPQGYRPPYLQMDRTHSPRGFLTGQTHSLIDNLGVITPVSSYSGMAYDPDGNRLSETADQPARGSAPSLSRTLTYNYDHLDELTGENSTAASGADASANYTRTWLYDLAGNPTTNRTGGATFNADNQDTSLAYTGTGDPLALPVFATTEAATFDPEDRLTQTGATPDFYARYDGNGLRAWNSEASGAGSSGSGDGGSGDGSPSSGAGMHASPAYYLYDGDHPIAELDQAGSEFAFTVTGATGVEMRAYSPDSIPVSQVTAFTYDPQGSLSQPVTLRPLRRPAATDVRSSSLFDGYGLSSTFLADWADDFDPVGFGGQYGYYWDLSGLYLLGHRYYDPGTGRFLTRDPSGYGGGLNLYGYAGGNPVNESDPSGLDWLDSLSNFSAGAGDVISGNLTQKFRQHLGYDDVVDKNSGAYHGGQVAGVAYLAVDTVVGGVGVVNGVRAIRAAGGIRGAIGAYEVARAARLGLPHQVRASGAVHVLENARTLSVTEDHFENITRIFRPYNGGRINLLRRGFWRDALPHKHTYSLGSPHPSLNANWRKTFERVPAFKTTGIWRP